jgi:predicted transcriptional regulator
MKIQTKILPIFLILFITFSCAKVEKEISNGVKSTPSTQLADRLMALQKSIDFGKVRYYTGTTKTWKDAWEYYKKIPEICAKKGITDEKDLFILNQFTLNMITDPTQYGAFISEDIPTQTEAIQLIEEGIKWQSIGYKSKATIYRYLQKQSLSSEAADFDIRTKDKAGNISQIDKTLELITKQLEDLHNRISKRKSMNKGQKRYIQMLEYKIEMVKKLSNK